MLQSGINLITIDQTASFHHWLYQVKAMNELKTGPSKLGSHGATRRRSLPPALLFVLKTSDLSTTSSTTLLTPNYHCYCPHRNLMVPLMILAYCASTRFLTASSNFAGNEGHFDDDLAWRGGLDVAYGSLSTTSASRIHALV